MKFFKYSLTPDTSSNVVFSFSGQILTLGVAFICMPLFIRSLGSERVGILSIIWVIVGYLTILDFGMGPAIIKHVSLSIAQREHERISTIFWNAFLIQAVFGMIGGGLLIATSSSIVTRALNIPLSLHGEAKISFIIAGVAFPAVISSNSIAGLLQSIHRFDLIAFNQVASGVGQFVLPLLAAIFIKSLPIAVLIILLIRIVSVVVLFYFSIRLIPDIRGKWHISVSDMKRLLKYGGWITVSSIFSPLLVYADRFILGYLLPVAAVAYYSVPSDAVIRLLIIPRSIMSVLFPIISGMKIEEKEERINELVFRSLRYIGTLLGIFIPLAIAFSSDILRVWLGKEYAQEGATALQILLVGIYFCSLSIVPLYLLQAIGRADISAKIHLAEFIVFSSISFLLIQKYGIVGAAGAWSLRLIVEMIILFSYSSRNAKLKCGPLEVKRIMLICAMAAALLLTGRIIALIVSSLLLRITGAFILGTIGCIFSWGAVFSPTDRQMFLDLIHKGKNYVLR